MIKIETRLTPVFIMNGFGNMKIFTELNNTLVILIAAVCFLYPVTVNARQPLLYGATDGSIYRDYVRIYWFESGSTATISRNGGDAVSYEKGSAIQSDGQYLVSLSVSENGQVETSTVSFEIDSTRPIAELRTNGNPLLTKLIIEFEPDTYSGNPMFVLWAEDMEGSFLQNLFVSTSAATNYMRFSNNIVARPQALPYWAHKTCPSSLNGGDTIYISDPVTPVPEGLDGVSGATQKLGFQLQTHVLTGGDQNMIRVLFEINQSFDDGWYFATDNPVREETDTAAGATFGEDRFFYGSEEPSLVYRIDVPLDQPGTYSVTTPVGYGHYGGRTGTLYTDFFALDGSVERHKFDWATQMVDHISVTVHALAGDLTGDCKVDLGDVITGLRLCTGENIPVNGRATVGTGEQIGMEEVIYILEKSAQ